MINTYSYYDSPQGKLHKFVLSFFNRIEFETGAFSVSFFEKEFYDNLVSRHRTILGKAFRNIYDEVKTWNQVKRSRLCEQIRKSNDIKSICAGRYKPLKSKDIPVEVRDVLHKLFIQLYEDVLKGKIFKAAFGGRLDHYHSFRKHGKNNYEFCPVCGIVEMKTYEDDKTDQYDHYLPKDVYPFSSVNFENLVPICTDCNSLEVKGADDILRHTGVVFYPYDEKRPDIEIAVKITRNNGDLEKINWEISYRCSGGWNNEIRAWQTIYKIESRHMNHVKGSIKTWYTRYYDYFNSSSAKQKLPNDADRNEQYLLTIAGRKVLEAKAMNALIDSISSRSISEASTYSRY